MRDKRCRHRKNRKLDVRPARERADEWEYVHKIKKRSQPVSRDRERLYYEPVSQQYQRGRQNHQIVNREVRRDEHSREKHR